MELSNQQRVWQVISEIPVGRVASYGQIAELAGLPGRARWVGTLLRKLPADTHLPWHRVLSSQGKIALAADSPSAHRQIKRLREEGVFITGNKLNMTLYRWQP